MRVMSAFPLSSIDTMFVMPASDEEQAAQPLFDNSDFLAFVRCLSERLWFESAECAKLGRMQNVQVQISSNATSMSRLWISIVDLGCAIQ